MSMDLWDWFSRAPKEEIQRIVAARPKTMREPAWSQWMAQVRDAAHRAKLGKALQTGTKGIDIPPDGTALPTRHFPEKKKCRHCPGLALDGHDVCAKHIR